MITYPFEYTRAQSLDEAVALAAAEPDAKILAGGQTLIPTMKQRLAAPPRLIDISRLSQLSFIRRDGDALVIGATTRHADVASSADVMEAIPALALLAGEIGDPAVRHLGTIGGSLANNDPAADYPAAALGLGATLTTNKRSLAADDFFTGMFSTALEEGEILTEISFPLAEKAGYCKFPNPASRYAMVGVFVAKTKVGARVAVTGAGSCVFRVPRMEAALNADFTSEAVAGISVPADDLNSDLHGSAEYRAHLVTVMAKRAVEAANRT
ncbi:MAG: xanthine dehydrogenase family protein subunit M [Alphaproteobacteria bacterium]|nr:xanthine dehydrogenase family protein subunit M [Alphaproteobacteria bacterium]MBU6472932.1 xanthine dehydrogenase family protein subunit M [Alphaproteobacteria bacterium]MDE2012694.1 xanthine dehydrogenase family protein subunit M [Alphaproteobacteria bacterium]MDE2072018.1 xanthine dehydrogenase family protein subunit M [Alphaproteobacteria bacterium]MDE2350866.1 xanthine dehydrogenase family protein subunit M [Alphaproteobacteria bacterium]